MTSVTDTPNSEVSRSRALQERGVELAKDLDIDIAAYNIAGNLISVHTLMKQMVERGPLREANLSLTAFVALWSIWVAGELEGNEVAAELGVARSSFSELAGRLEQRGFISRHQSPNDGRVVLFRLTVAGTNVVTETWPLMNDQIERMAVCLSGEEQRVLAQQMRRLTAHLELMQDEA